MTFGTGWLLVLGAVDYAIPPGALTLHPMSDTALEEVERGEPKHIPDPDVELVLVSYTLPTRIDSGPGSLGKLGCSFTLSVENGKTSASVDEKAVAGEKCSIGALAPEVVASLQDWTFGSSLRAGRYWLPLDVHYEEGSTTAEVDIPQAHLASAMPAEPYAGLHIVSRPSPRTRAKPKMPDAAKHGGSADLACKAHFWLDERGTPTDITVRECPPEFLDSVLEAAWQWRFDPYVVDGKARSGEFDLEIKFKVH